LKYLLVVWLVVAIANTKEEIGVVSGFKEDV